MKQYIYACMYILYYLNISHYNTANLIKLGYSRATWQREPRFDGTAQQSKISIIGYVLVIQLA